MSGFLFQANLPERFTKVSILLSYTNSDNEHNIVRIESHVKIKIILPIIGLTGLLGVLGVQQL